MSSHVLDKKICIACVEVGEYRRCVVILTGSKLYLVDLEKNLISTLPIPEMALNDVQLVKPVISNKLGTPLCDHDTKY